MTWKLNVGHLFLSLELHTSFCMTQKRAEREKERERPSERQAGRKRREDLKAISNKWSEYATVPLMYRERLAH